jgi:hypothetical protein
MRLFFVERAERATVGKLYEEHLKRRVQGLEKRVEELIEVANDLICKNMHLEAELERIKDLQSGYGSSSSSSEDDIRIQSIDPHDAEMGVSLPSVDEIDLGEMFIRAGIHFEKGAGWR